MKIVLIFMMILGHLNGFARLTATWTGIAGIYLTDGKTGIYFDPVFSRPTPLDVLRKAPFKLDSEFTKKVIKKIKAKYINAIFFTHTHYDHYADAPQLAKSHGSILHGSETAKYLSLSSGVPKNQIRVFKNGSIYKYGDFEIEVVKASHGKILRFYNYQPGNLTKIVKTPIKLSHYQQGGSYSFLVKHKDKKILIQQAPRPTPNLKGKKADIVFQTIANRRSTKELDEKIWKLVGAKHIIPTHQDNFFFPIRDEKKIDYLYFVKMDEFRDYIKKAQYKLTEPRYYQAIEL